jgi:hypothetical protein
LPDTVMPDPDLHDQTSDIYGSVRLVWNKFTPHKLELPVAWSRRPVIPDGHS